MANLGTITYKVKVDTSDVTRSDRTMEGAKKTADNLGKSVERTGKKFDKAGKESKAATDKINKGLTASERAMQTVKRAATALVISLATRQIVAYADAWNNASNQLRQVTDGTQELEKAQRDLLAVANETRSGFEATATLFSRLKRSTTELAISDERLLAVTKTINQTFATSGATAQEASAAITQLTQGLAAGALRGQEYNSVLEQAPGIARAIAQSLNLTLGELRAFAAEGKITAEIVVNALEESAEALDVKFNKTVVTFGQNMAIANNSILEFVGNSGTAQTAVALAGAAVVLLAENIDLLADVAIAAAVAFTASLIPALAAITGPIGVATLAIVAFADAFLRLKRARQEAFTGAVQQAFNEGIQSVNLFILATENSISALEAERDALGTNRAARNRRLGVEEQLLKKGEELAELQRARNTLLDEEDQQTGDVIVSAGILTTRLSGLKTKYTELTGAMVPLNVETMLQNNSLLDMETVMTNLRTAIVPGYTDTLKDNTFRMEGVKLATKEATKEMDFQKNMIENVQREWGNLFFDLLEGEASFKDFFSAVTDAFKRMVAEMAAQKLAEVIFGGGGLGGVGDAITSLFDIGGGGGGGPAPVSTSSSAGTPTTPGVPSSGGGGGFTRAASTALDIGANLVAGFAGNAAGTAIGESVFDDKVAQSNTAATIGALIGSFSGPLGTFIGATLGSFIDVAAGGDDFVRQNAGFLLSSVGDADREFDVPAFASGFNPVGFSRRSSQAQATSVINLFRDFDTALTAAAQALGLTVSLGATSFGGFDEQAMGNGLFFGHGVGPGGTAGTPLEEQLNRFVSQWVTAVGLTNGISLDNINNIIGSGDANEILGRAQGTNGSFQTGLDRVPFDGFIAELHQGERVLTNGQANQQDALNQEAGPGRGNVGNMLFQLLKSVFKTARIIRQWDRNGLPPERTA